MSRRLALSLVTAAATLAVGLTLGPAPDAEAGRGGGTYVYVHDPAFGPTLHRIYGFKMSKKGQLEPLPGSPFSTTQSVDFNRGGGFPSMTYSRKRKMLVTVGDTFVTTWGVNRDGSLDLLTELDTQDAGHTFSIAAVDRGRDSYVYATTTANTGLYAYELQKDGSLDALSGSPFTDYTNPFVHSVLRRDLLLQSGEGFRTLSVGKDGTLTDGRDSPAAADGEFGGTLTGLDSRGRLAVYSSGTQLKGAKYRRRRGTLSHSEAEAVTTDLANTDYGVTLTKRGTGFVVAKTTTSEDALQAIEVDRRTGAVTLLGDPQDIGLARPRARALDRRERILICAASLNEKQVATYAIDRRTGELTEIDREDLTDISNSTAVVVVKR